MSKGNQSAIFNSVCVCVQSVFLLQLSRLVVILAVWRWNWTTVQTRSGPAPLRDRQPAQKVRFCLQTYWNYPVLTSKEQRLSTNVCIPVIWYTRRCVKRVRCVFKGLVTCAPVRPWLCDDCWKLPTATWASPARRKVWTQMFLVVVALFFLVTPQLWRNVVTLFSSCSVRSWGVPQQAFPAPESGAAPQDQVWPQFIFLFTNHRKLPFCCRSHISVLPSPKSYAATTLSPCLALYTELLSVWAVVAAVQTWSHVRLHQRLSVPAFPAFFWDKGTELWPAVTSLSFTPFIEFFFFFIRITMSLLVE